MITKLETQIPDISVSHQGTICLFHPQTEAARLHLEAQCPGATWFGGALVVEHRYAGEITAALQRDGFMVG